MCIEWRGALTPDGYPRRLYRGNYNTRWHRVVYCQTHGIPLKDIDGLIVRHTCDNSKCIDPNHLVIGTPKDNMRDRGERERDGNRKLTNDQVIEIHHLANSGAVGKTLALQFGVNARTISSIRHKKHFKWLLGG